MAVCGVASHAKQGHDWQPKKRRARHGLINLQHGAIKMVKQSTGMIMAAYNGAKGTDDGGLNTYTHIYEADISQHATSFTGANPARGASGCGMAIGSYRVRTLKGDGPTSWQTKYAATQALGLTWSDSCKCTPMVVLWLALSPRMVGPRQCAG